MCVQLVRHLFNHVVTKDDWFYRRKMGSAWLQMRCGPLKAVAAVKKRENVSACLWEPTKTLEWRRQITGNEHIIRVFRKSRQINICQVFVKHRVITSLWIKYFLMQDAFPGSTPSASSFMRLTDCLEHNTVYTHSRESTQRWQRTLTERTLSGAHHQLMKTPVLLAQPDVTTESQTVINVLVHWDEREHAVLKVSMLGLTQGVRVIAANCRDSSSNP